MQKKGTYNDKERQSSCFSCGPGKFNDKLGSFQASECLECPAGYYCPDERTVSPIVCPADFYCPKGTGEPSECKPLHSSPEQSTVSLSI